MTSLVEMALLDLVGHVGRLLTVEQKENPFRMILRFQSKPVKRLVGTCMDRTSTFVVIVLLITIITTWLLRMALVVQVGSSITTIKAYEDALRVKLI